MRNLKFIKDVEPVITSSHDMQYFSHYYSLVSCYKFSLISLNIDAFDLPIFKGQLFWRGVRPMIDGGGQGQMLLHIPC